MDLKFLTVNTISTLSYKDLLKLSSKYKLQKRWPKKEDLIRNLIEVKEKSEKIEWRDAADLLKNPSELPNSENEDPNRLTFTVEDPSRSTFTVPPTDSRLTFNITEGKAKSETVVSSKIKMLTVPYSPPKRKNTMNISNKSIAIRRERNKPSTEVKKTLRTIHETSKKSLITTPIINTTARRKSKSHDGTTPITASKARKMPNFAKLHEQEFAKMTSIDDYLKNKTKRARMMSAPMSLPGKQSIKESKTTEHCSITKSPAPTVSSNNKTSVTSMTKTPVKGGYDGRYSRIIMKSPTTSEKILPKKTSVQTAKTPLKTPVKNLTTKTKQKAETDMKVNVRNALNGIRSNRRFELQMKFRNCV